MTDALCIQMQVSIEEQRKTAALVPGARMYEFDCGHEIPERTLEGTASIMLSHSKGNKHDEFPLKHDGFYAQK